MQTEDRVIVDLVQKRPTRGPLIGMVAGAVLAFSALLLFQSASDTSTDQPVVTEVPEPEQHFPTEIAAAFVDAYGAFDVDEAASYLAADADTSGLRNGSDWRLGNRWLKAVGFKLTPNRCYIVDHPPPDVGVRCGFDYHILGSDEIGLGPLKQGWFDLRIVEAEIVSASIYWEYEAELLPLVWKPFAEWVAETHRGDVGVMYTDSSQNLVQLTEESIALWEQHIGGYVAEVRRLRDGDLSRIVGGVPFSFEMPTGGWEFGPIERLPDGGFRNGNFYISKSTVGPQNAEAVIFWTSYPDGDYASPCASLLSPPVGSSAGPSAADLATAVASAPGTELVTGPADVTVGGYPAKYVVVIVQEDLGCDPGFFFTWQEQMLAVIDGEIRGGVGPFWGGTNAGDTIRVWVVDVDGVRLFIEAETTKDASLDLSQEEIHQIVQSIRFDSPARPTDVAAAFVEAYGAFDVERAASYLAGDADASGLEGGVGWRRTNRWLEATGFKLILESCFIFDRPPGGQEVRCRFGYHLLGSDEIGLGPFSGSWFDVNVAEDEIVSASWHWDIAELSVRVWEPFAVWVAEKYPEDVAVMYTNPSLGRQRLTEESILLWEQHSREYVAEEMAEVVDMAESFMEARNASDAERAISLLADGPVTVQLLDGAFTYGNMPTVLPLRRDELALAFEAEQLYEFRYESLECRPDPVVGDRGGVYVTCSYLMDDRLRQIEGYPPVESSARLRIRDGRIDLLGFPGLNISWNEPPREFEAFKAWLGATHPEAGSPMVDGELFYSQGQELMLILTRESLDLLAGYLDEYESFANG
jgi:hypothetical protein